MNDNWKERWEEIRASWYELTDEFQNILDKYGEVESINYWSVFDDYEDILLEILEETQDVNQINDALLEEIYTSLSNENVNEDSGEELWNDAIPKLEAFVRMQNEEYIYEPEDTLHILWIGEKKIIEEVLEKYHERRMEILERELEEINSNQREM